MPARPTAGPHHPPRPLRPPPLTGLPLLAALLLAACDTVEPPLRDDEFQPGCEASTAIKVDEKGTYLRTNDDRANGPTIIRLSAVNVAPGDSVLLERFGSFQYQSRTDPSRTRFRMAAVFSANDTVLPGSERNRVPGALATRLPTFETMRTFRGGLETTIPQQFEVAQTRVRVPAGAAFLFVTPNDDLFEDNTDASQDYRICITKLN